MPIQTLTKMTCDLKGCGKSFLVPDDAPKLPPGTEEIIRTVDAHGNKLVFCTRLHLVAFMVAYLKATPAETKKSQRKREVAVSEANLQKLQDAGIISRESAPSEVPPAPESLNLEDDNTF